MWLGCFEEMVKMAFTHCCAPRKARRSPVGGLGLFLGQVGTNSPRRHLAARPTYEASSPTINRPQSQYTKLALYAPPHTAPVGRRVAR